MKRNEEPKAIRSDLRAANQQQIIAQLAEETLISEGSANYPPAGTLAGLMKKMGAVIKKALPEEIQDNMLAHMPGYKKKKRE